ncbi:MAG TPA: hypothetical protein VJ719_16245, partial [Chthoniobacterales bacterium]|nr:hypothetical protein [Chthoniobacterales bacterium]
MKTVEFIKFFSTAGAQLVNLDAVPGVSPRRAPPHHMKKFALTALLFGCAFGVVRGQLYVTDPANDNVVQFNQTTGAFEGIFVPGGNSWSPNDATGLTFGPDGNLYVVGTGTGFVMRFDGSDGSPLPGPNVLVPPMFTTSQFTTFSGFNGALNGAQDIVFGTDVSGDLYPEIYVSNGSSNKISVFNGATGDWIADHTLISPGGSNPAFVGMTVSPSGQIYVVDGNDSPFDIYASNVLRFDPVAGTFIPFVVTAANQGNFRTAITFSPDGQFLYVSNWGGGAPNFFPPQIQRFSGTTGAFIDSFMASGLNQPRGLEFGPDGNLYIANFFHNPPTFMDPGTPGMVFRYDGTSASPFAVGGNPANFFD